MTIPTLEEVVSFYLYGHTRPPADKAAASVVRDMKQGARVKFDRPIKDSEFMNSTDGPGRFALPSEFLIIDKFFKGEIPLQSGTYSLDELLNKTGYKGDRPPTLDISQWNYGDSTDDFVYRSFIWGVTGFAIGPGASFKVDDDGKRSIAGLKIIPYTSPSLPENFDFLSDGLLSRYFNASYKQFFDPSDIGRTVTFEFDHDQAPSSYTQSEYNADSQKSSANLLAGNLQFKAHSAVNDVTTNLADRLWNAGVIDPVKQGGYVVYGSRDGETIDPYAKLRPGFFEVGYPRQTALLKVGGYIVAGAGDDTLVPAGRVTHMFGGAGADHFKLAGNVIVEDGESVPGESVSYLGFRLYGGAKQWWSDSNIAYWAGFSSLLTMFPVAGAAVLATAALFVDQVTMKFVRYQLDENNTLKIDLAWGLGGTAAIKNYNLDDDTGTGTAGVTVFQFANAGAKLSHERFRKSVNLALYAGFGSGLPGFDPLVLDLDGDGFSLTTEANSKTYFEFDSDGFAEHTGWVKATDGLLVLDRNANGKIDNVTELFGNRNTAGFDMLAGLDSNLDGVMNAVDTVFSELKVWQDLNQDGVTDAGELKTLSEMGIVSISLAHAAPAQPKDVAGNTIVHEGQFTWADGSLGAIGDVAFDISDTNTRWMGDTTVSTSAAALPQLTGFGEVKDLRVAMSCDASLQAQVAAFVANPTNDLAVLKADAEAILYHWAGVADAPATPLGGNEFDTRKLAFLEKYSGVALMPRGVSGAILLDNIAEMESLWKDQVTRLTLRLVVQGPLADVFTGITYRADRDLLVASGPSALSNLLHNLLVDLPTDPVAAQAQWAGWAPLLGAVVEGMVRSDANVVRDDFLFAQLVSAMDGVAQPLSLDQLVSALGIPNVRIGTASAETLARGAAAGTAIYYSGGGDDTLTGGSGQDAYVFGRSIGHVTINDIEAKPAGDRIRFAFLNASQVTMKRDGYDLLITVTTTNETVRVVGQFAPVTAMSSDVLLSSDKGVEDIQFADGTVMEIPEIMAAVGTGTAGNDHMIGTMHSDVFLGGLGDDRLEGGDDADLYVVNAGEGHDVISDVQTTPLLRAADMLVFGDNIAPEDLVFARTGTGGDDLKISIGASGQSVLIEGQFGYSSLGYNAKFDINSRIEAFAFRESSGGWSSHELQQRMIEDATTAGADETLGFGDDDVFQASAGNDLLIGLDGADTYRWGLGSGNDRIEERARYIDVNVGLGGLGLGGNDDKIEFGPGLTAADVTFSRPTSAPDLIITIKATGETLTVKNQFDGFQTGTLGEQWFDRIEGFAFEDGTKLSWKDVLTKVMTGTDGDDVLTGDLSKDRLAGGKGNDILRGLGLGDTYVFNLGDGRDIIDDANESFLGAGFVTLDTDADVLELGPGITVANTAFSRNGDDVTLSFAGGDQVTLKGQNDYFHSGVFGVLSTNRVEEVRFADGAKMSWQDINQRLIANSTSSGNDVTEGFRLPDRFLASPGDDVLAGGDSGDTYEFGHGSGHDIIRESVSNVLYGDQDLVEFGLGVLPSDVLVSRSVNNADTVILTLASTGDTLTVEDEFSIGAWFTWTDVELFRFADGTEWTKSDLQRRLLQSTAGDDTLVAFDSDDVLDGGAGNDVLVGRDGQDTYVFGRGYGTDVVRESRGNHNLAENDCLTFGVGITAADIVVTRNANDLILSIAGTNDSIRIEGQFNFDQWFSDNDVESFVFADGTVWSDRDVAAMLTGGTSGADHIIGTFRTDVLDGKGGDDILEGGDGSDTYVFGRGYGRDEIRESRSTANLAEDDQLRFGPGITLQELNFERSGNDLVISILGTQDSVRITGQFSYGAFQAWEDVERFTFEDGTFLTKQDATQITLRPKPTDDHYFGSIDDDTLDGGAGNDILEGLDGADTYRFGRGSGRDEIREDVTHVFLSDFDVVVFGAGVAPADVLLTRSGDDVIIGIAGTQDSLTIKDQFEHGAGYTWHDIERFDFADGTSWSQADLKARLSAQAGTPGDDMFAGFDTADLVHGGAGNDTLAGDTNNDQLFGDAGNDKLDGQKGDDLIVGGIGDDLLSGGGGSDTFRIELGDGNDTISERVNFDGGWGGYDKLSFGAGISPADVAVSFADDGASLLLKIGAMQTVRLYNTLNDPDFRIEEANFADGTVWLAADLLARANAPTLGNDLKYGGYDADTISGGAGDDIINGRGGDDTLSGDAGNDTLHGAGGNDTYLFGRGDGQDIVSDFSGSFYDGDGGLDTVQFRSGILPSDVIVSQANGGNDIVLKIAGTTDQITLSETMNSIVNRIEQVRFADGTLWDRNELVTRSAGATAGDDNLFGDNLSNSLFGGAGNDVINARGGDDTLSGDAGNDVLHGAGGNDTYLFGRGGGQDVVIDFSGSFYDGDGGFDTVQFAEDITPADVTVSQVNGGSDIVLKIVGSTDQITLADTANARVNRIEQVRFANGTTWSHAELVSRSTAANAGNDSFGGTYDGETINGGPGNDSINARGGDDTLSGDDGDDVLHGAGGNDTYLFGRGGGRDTVIDFSGNFYDGDGGFDTVQFADGLAPSDIVVSQTNGGNDLVLRIAGTDDQITLADTANARVNRIEQVRFADGTTWSHAELVSRSTAANSGNDAFGGTYDGELIRGGAGNDEINARGGDDTLSGDFGDDILHGAGGNDTYLFSRGDGQDRIVDFSGSFYDGDGGFDTVRFSSGISPADIVVSQADAGNDLVLKIAGTTDQVTLVDTVFTGVDRIEQVQFADGTIWSYAEVLARALRGTEGNDNLIGDNAANTLNGLAGDDVIDGRWGDDTLIGATGNDVLSGDGGNDTYVFNRGDGKDTISESSGTGAGGEGGYDRVEFGAGISPADITVGKADNGGSYVLYLNGGEDRLSLVGAATWGRDYEIEEVRFAGGTVWTKADLEARAGSASDGDDTLIGTAGDDTIRGLGGNDTLKGDAGNDSLTGGRGNDVLDGGPGDDVAVFSGVLSDYRIAGWGSTLTVTDLAPTVDGDDGADQLAGIERLQFKDGTILAPAPPPNSAPTGLKLFSSNTPATLSALVGSAGLAAADTYILTPNAGGQNGAVWGDVDLSSDVSWTTRMFFGSSDWGADGVAFALQNAGTSVLGGYGVLTPTSIGIRFDTYSNAGEPGSDFSQIVLNGQTGSTQFDTFHPHPNLEDGVWRNVVIDWASGSRTLSYSLDGAKVASKSFDVVGLFGGDATVQFGFGAATGGASNDQRVQLVSMTTAVDHFTVIENAAGGALVGKLFGVDADQHENLTYSIVDPVLGTTGHALFEVVNGNELRVKAGASIDYETASSHVLDIKVVDSAGASLNVPITVEVRNLVDSNEAPTGLNLLVDGTAPTVVVGSASKLGSDAFQLTPNAGGQNGAVWGAVDLSADAVWKTKMYFGGSDGGADGVGFGFQNSGTSVSGGYGVLTTASFGVRFDTYVNSDLGEPGSDFSQFVRNGITGVQANQFDTYHSHANIEDNAWHDVIIAWNAASKTLSYSLDGTPIAAKTYDVVGTTFGGDSTVQYGFGGSTGGASNDQRVQIMSVQAGVSRFKIQENAGGGVLLGRLEGRDNNPGDVLTYAVVDSAGAATEDPWFQIVNGNELRVRSGASIDYETATSHDLRVRITDAAGASIVRTVGIDVLNMPEGQYVGTPANDVIRASNANDVVLGLAGNDTLVGGEGDDHMQGGLGDDLIFGDQEVSVLVPTGTNYIQNGSFEQVGTLVSNNWWGIVSSDLPGWTKSNSQNVKQIVSGVVNTYASDGNYWFETDSYGGPGSNMIISQGIANLTPGQVMILKFDHASRVSATDGAFQVLWNGELVATVSETGTVMREKAYEVVAAAGVNTLTFKGIGDENGAGASLDNVRLFATEIQGSPGNDLIEGGDGNDTLVAGGGNDLLYGDAGNDLLDAGGGNDVLQGGAGDDTLLGGAGDDVIRVGVGDGVDAVDGGLGSDMIVALGADTVIGLKSVANVETISSGGFANVSISGSAGADTLNFAAVTLMGITRIDGAAGDDVITGGAGDDVLIGGAGNDTLAGGLGIDVAVYAGLQPSYSLITGSGSIQIVDNEATVDGNDGTDILTGIEKAEFKGGVQVALAAPIVLDLDGNGVQLVNRDKSKAKFDWDGDGKRDKTGWVGKGDGILVYDRDGNGTVSGANELSFLDDKPGAKSDLDGLSAFDTNHDGAFSDQDAAWAKFRVWKDRDSDGKVDKGEFISLAQAGVASISLAGVATERSWGWSENIMVNNGQFTRTDGSVGALGDVALNYAASTKGQAGLMTTSGILGKVGKLLGRDRREPLNLSTESENLRSEEEANTYRRREEIMPVSGGASSVEPSSESPQAVQPAVGEDALMAEWNRMTDSFLSNGNAAFEPGMNFADRFSNLGAILGAAWPINLGMQFGVAPGAPVTGAQSSGRAAMEPMEDGPATMIAPELDVFAKRFVEASAAFVGDTGAFDGDVMEREQARIHPLSWGVHQRL